MPSRYAHFGYKLVQWNRCIVGFVQQVYSSFELLSTSKMTTISFRLQYIDSYACCCRIDYECTIKFLRQPWWMIIPNNALYIQFPIYALNAALLSLVSHKKVKRFNCITVLCVTNKYYWVWHTGMLKKGKINYLISQWSKSSTHMTMTMTMKICLLP